MAEENTNACHCYETIKKLEIAVEENSQHLQNLRDSFRILNRNVLCVLNVTDRPSPAIDFPSMPLQNEAAFVEFEQLLNTNRSIMLNFDQMLQKQCGKDLKSAIRAKLRATFSNDLANICSFFGKNQKIYLEDKKIITAIKESAIKQLGGATIDADQVIKRWFQTSGDRLKLGQR